ncbi:hypothetical protein TcasGA2_TC012178 [Tribolium castaneum]|uniref:Uncharacterized protein n=1 Tax=Tribolium castaneum TaxID=7070 RepID=D6X0M8_TRICA|nr:PREDICTED: uncharacterized protein LOC661778 [Tribolium castaneum]EFA10008.1 hypothetical protein TcasGA2_TC012178 [Tribolium castaneum]|eukprot:XP_973012.1 PREDICTED: uncharacterized protein LOC661778 [Tribolium castaneum]
MRKFVFVALALLVAISTVQCDDSSEEVLEHIKSRHLKKYLHGQREHLDDGLEKLEKHCPGVSEKLKVAVKEFSECDDKVDDSLTICEAIHAYTINCTAPLLKVVNDCLPEKARGLPNLGMKSMVSVAEHLCKQSGESIFELVNPCLWEDLEEANTEMDACEEKVKALGQKYKENIPTQSELCSSITDLRTCIQKRATLSCKNQKTRNAILGVFDAAVAPCSHLNAV